MPSTGANGVDVWFEQEGDGHDVLFISGLADEGACWVDQVAGLKDRYRLTTFDNRGVGRSSTPDGPFQIADFAADTIALMDALGLQRPHVVQIESAAWSSTGRGAAETGFSTRSFATGCGRPRRPTRSATSS
jgi:alpha/beta hydrolase fold